MSRGLPLSLSRPIPRSLPNKIIDRVLEVVIGLKVIGVAFDDLSFDEFDGSGRIRMSTQIVTKQQGIALVRVAVDPNMHIRTPPAVWLIEEKLSPQLGVIVFAQRHMILGDGFPILVARFDKPLPNFRR